MKNYTEIIRDSISNALNRLSWRCGGCPQILICEEQANGGESRYCWPIIEAAILGNGEWITEHNKGKINGQQLNSLQNQKRY